MNFRRLVAPVFIAVAISIAAFIGVVVVAASMQDEASLDAERQVISQHLQAKHLSLAVLAEDNAWWDVAVEHVLVNEDVEWIDATLGESVNGIKNIQGVLVVRADGGLIYANFVNRLAPPHAFLDAGISDLVRGLPAPDNKTPLSRSGLMLVNGQLVAFGASIVQSAGILEFPAELLSKRRPAFVFVAHLTRETLATMGEDNAIANLRLTNNPGELDSNLPLKDFHGNPIGYLVWDPAAPGSQMVRNMILPSALLLVLVILALARFVRQASHMVRELESANRAKSAFLASTSHEIRTPLNAIIGFTELISLELYGKVEGEKNKEYLQLIRDSGEHLLSIINDILDISKLEAERFEIFAERVDPLPVVTASRKIVLPAAGEKNIEVIADCEPATLFSDERIMRQVLINLLSNAVKFTPKNGTVTVTGKVVGKNYVLSVTDTGIGMSESDITKALSLFGQVQSEYARSHTGTGLGLPLVTRFMDLLGGSFDIASTPGKGTTVTLGFPLHAGNEGP